MNKRQLYENIMKNVSYEVKKVLNEINSSTYFNAADKQELLLNDDDYILNHTPKELVHNKKRILKFRDFGNDRKDEEYFIQRQNEIKAERQKSLIIIDFQNKRCDPFLELLRNLITDDIIKDSVIYALYDNDLFDFMCGDKPIDDIESIFTDMSNNHDIDEDVLNYIVKEINKKSSIKFKIDYDYRMIIPDNFKIPSTFDEDDIIDYIYNIELDDININNTNFYNDIAKNEVLEELLLKWNGEEIEFIDDNIDGCKFKYFIDCTGDSEISSWCCNNKDDYDDNNVIFIRNANASSYSNYIGILCKYKKDANEIVTEIEENTEYGVDILILSKDPQILWSFD